MLSAALFDIDGTLVNTAALIREAVEQVLREDGIIPTWEEITAGLSLRAADRMRRWARSEGHAEALAVRYVERYLVLHDELVRPYPGMEETLETLSRRGISMGVVTSKRREPALKTLGAFGLGRFFRIVVCEEDGALPKPDPGPLLLAAARLGVAPDETVMIGDAASDIRAGRNAGMETVGAWWGTVEPDALRAAKPTWLIAQPADLLSLFEA